MRMSRRTFDVVITSTTSPELREVKGWVVHDERVGDIGLCRGTLHDTSVWTATELTTGYYFAKAPTRKALVAILEEGTVSRKLEGFMRDHRRYMDERRAELERLREERDHGGKD